MVALKPREIDRFLAAPDPEIDAVLVYGPDRGLVAERARLLLNHFADDPQDPFAVSFLDEAELARAPERLADELSGLAFGASRRTVVVRTTGGSAADAIAGALAAPRAAVLIVEGAELRPQSRLRKAFESGRDTAALPCYVDDERAVGGLIDSVLSEFGQSIDAEARAALVGRLGADRMASRGEIEKLALYAGPGARITPDDVAAICADASQSTLDALVDAMGEGDTARLEDALVRANEATGAPGQVAWTALQHLQRLHRLAASVAAGTTASDAISALRPPVFFTRRDSLTRQLRRWSEPELRRALAIATDAERSSRGDQTLASTVISRALLQIALLPRAGRR